MDDNMKDALEHLIDRFETYASDQLACRRFQATAKAKRDCEIKAETYKAAVADVRDVMRQLESF